MNSSTDTFWVALGAIATLLAVAAALVIAVWGPLLGGLFFKPKPKVSIEMMRPDCIKILTNAGLMSSFESYYFRLRITNDGNREAEDVEVRMRHLRISTNGVAGARDDPNFVPLNLTWANTDNLPAVNQVRASRIQPKLDKHCNLCRILHDNELNPLMEFLTEVTPNAIRPGEWFTKKLPGNYLLDIAVSANNARVVYKTLRLQFAGWFDDEKTMFQKGLVVSITD